MIIQKIFWKIFFFLIIIQSFFIVQNSFAFTNQECISNGYGNVNKGTCYKEAGNIFIFSSSTSYAVDNCKNSDWTQTVACPTSYTKPTKGCIVSDYQESGDLCVAKVPTCTITKKETANPTSGEFNHVLYGLTTGIYSDTYPYTKYSGNNNEVSEMNKIAVIESIELGMTDDEKKVWQQYSEYMDNTTSNDGSGYYSNPVNTKYFVYGDKPRYALTTIKNAENNFIITIQANRWD